MKRSRVASLRRCLKLWEYLAKTGKRKHEAYVDLGLKWDFNLCPACEFNTSHEGFYCEDTCIVDWGAKFKHCNFGFYGPKNRQAPFARWSKPGTIKERKFQARVIVRLIKVTMNKRGYKYK